MHIQIFLFFVPCGSSASVFVAVSPSSTGGSAATGSLAKDCQAVRSDPQTLFFRSMLMRVRLSFSSGLQYEKQHFSHPGKSSQTQYEEVTDSQT